MPKRLEEASVTSADAIAPGLVRLGLEAPAIAAQAAPGQLVLVQCADPAWPVFDPFLPRPYFIFDTDRSRRRISLLVQHRGRGGAWLSARPPGATVRLHGPIGREVRAGARTSHLLLLADGVAGLAGTAPVGVAASRRGVSVALVAGQPAGEPVVPPEVLPAEVEYRAAPAESGGLAGALAELLGWAGEVIVAGGAALLQTLGELRRQKLEPFTLYAGTAVQAIPLPDPAAPEDFPPIPCGSGACGACLVPAHGGGARLLCRHGPAFPLEALRFPLVEAEPDAELAPDERSSGDAGERATY